MANAATRDTLHAPRFLAIGVHLHAADILGIEGITPLAIGDLTMSTIEVAHGQSLSTRPLLLETARLRHELLTHETFVAVRYGFAVTSAEEAESKSRVHFELWRRALTTYRGMVEMTMKVAATSTVERPDRHDFTSGADYLRALHVARAAATIDEEFRDAAQHELERAARMRWNRRDATSVELALLVARAEVYAIREGGERLKRAFPHVAFLLSGPWPLEVFADGE
jgi:hypothetical protein